MRRRKRNRIKLFITSILMFIAIFSIAFFGIQFITKTGVFNIPGVVYYDESLSPQELSILKDIFTDDIKLDEDVYISAEDTLEKPNLSEGEFLYNISVPITDFYDARTDTNEFDDDFDIISVDDLDFTKKLLAIDGNYYLNTFDKGAYYRTIVFKSEKYSEEIAPLVTEAFSKVFPEKDSVLTMAQTGVTALSRGMNAKLQSVGGDAVYFAEKIKDYLSSFDLTHTSNESSFTNFATSNNICSDVRFIDTLTAIGLDIVELTGNHNQDCGDEAASDSIDIYRENNIKIVGGGKSADEAVEPLRLNEKGTKIKFLAYNLSTGGATYDNTPGANQYYEENAVSEITEAKEQDEFVIVDIQYYECSSYDFEYENTTCDYADSAAGDQVGFFRHLIDLGADVVIGTSAHQPQTFELYGDGAIYYGLGNLFFDQVWWPGTTRSLVLEHYFYNGKLLQTRIVPTIYDQNMQTEILNKDDAKTFVERLVSARP